MKALKQYLCVLLGTNEQLTLPDPFNGCFSRTTWVCQHQKGKPFWILPKQEIMGWQWHQKLFACHYRQITMPVPHQSVFTGWMTFLSPNQQHKSTEGTNDQVKIHIYTYLYSQTTLCLKSAFFSPIQSSFVHM